MKNFLTAFFLLIIVLPASAQYWQQRVDYRIDVSLNEKDKTIDGFEKITYFNNSPDTLHYIWFHLWPNAYKNDRTAFSDQMLLNGNTAFYFSTKEQRGYINRLDYKVDGLTARLEDHPQHIDIAKLILPKPLPPGENTVITTPFHVKLPFNFSRGGYDGESFQLTQWYPKPAVYDHNGWHPMPYLDQGEYYSEFGSFDVSITVPTSYVVAATGLLTDAGELTWLKTRKEKLTPHPSNQPVKTLRFVQDSVHDFAWFANKNFFADYDTCQLASGKIIDVWSYYTAAREQTWKHAVRYSKEALHFYSTAVGEYPYAIATVVQGPQSFGGGMEYPTITVISPDLSPKNLDLTIAHELGHNWFYGALATNERQHPWMDEGMNSFYERKYENRKYATDQAAEIMFQTKAFNKTDQAIENPSEAFSAINYGLVVYHKTSEWMSLLEKHLGGEAFRSMMQEYYNMWKFRHPQPEHFRAIAEKSLGGETGYFFSLLEQKGTLPDKEFKGFTVISPLKKNSLVQYLKQPPKSALLLSPVAGFNVYDGLMVGAAVTNYKLPPTPFQFLAVPLFATGSKQLNGLGKLNYSITSNGTIRKTDVFINISRFSMDQFTDSTGKKHKMDFQKLVPGVKFTFREKDQRSQVTTYLQWKSFFINEEAYRAVRDTVINGSDTSILLRLRFPATNRYVNQLRFVYQNFSALYPFDIQLQLDQSSDFLRAGLTTNYFFNYQKGGGLNLRMFAGKFFHLKDHPAAPRYYLNMTGANGYEDFTYSDYFVGRNEFDNIWSQQIMQRDGGFKVRTEGLGEKIGKSDDWLIAFNLTTTVPDKLNPLSVLPINIPLRLFADFGTYAKPWKKDSEADRFLFDAGFYLPLFREVVNLYFPVVYSRPYSDFIKATIPKNRFFKTMSFKINFNTNELKKINQQVEF